VNRFVPRSLPCVTISLLVAFLAFPCHRSLVFLQYFKDLFRILVYSVKRFGSVGMFLFFLWLFFSFLFFLVSSFSVVAAMLDFSCTVVLHVCARCQLTGSFPLSPSLQKMAFSRREKLLSWNVYSLIISFENITKH